MSTKADQFDAFQIQKDQTNEDTNWEGEETYWYSPEVKRVVKSDPSWKEGFELLSYKLAESDDSPPEITIITPIVKNGASRSISAKEAIVGKVSDISDIRSVKSLPQHIVSFRL
ncbi:hypothetical protein ACFL0M_06380 [Thermodesulfobacteriota bacterium]